MKLTILMPAYNEASVIGTVLEKLPTHLPGIDTMETVVVDDGSHDATSSIARAHGAHVVRHRLNRGVGLAMITGIQAARRLRTDILVTIDSDGQHDPADIASVIEPILQGKADVVIGTRLSNPKGMPWIRLVGNQAMNQLIRLFSGVRTTDSQSGFRAYNRVSLEKLKLSTSGYEVCTEILVAAKKADLTVAEVPIRVIYTDYSKKKGQSITNAINIIVRLMTKAVTG